MFPGEFNIPYSTILFHYIIAKLQLWQMKSGIITWAAPPISWCDATGSKLFNQFCMHTQLFAVTEASGAVGLFVRTQVISLDFICHNCTFSTSTMIVLPRGSSIRIQVVSR